jgi:LPS-assembly lipoprotein
LLVVLALTACGFHLRGSVQLPLELAAINVLDAKSATDIAPALRNALKNAGTRVSDAAPMVLQLKAEQYGKRVLSVDSSGRAQEYGLSYTVRFLLKAEGAEAGKSVIWLAEEAVTQTRDLRFDSAAVLGTEGEEAQLKAEMRQDAVLQILRRLQVAKPPRMSQEPSQEQPGQESK